MGIGKRKAWSQECKVRKLGREVKRVECAVCSGERVECGGRVGCGASSVQCKVSSGGVLSADGRFAECEV